MAIFEGLGNSGAKKSDFFFITRSPLKPFATEFGTPCRKSHIRIAYCCREADGARQILLFPEGTNMAPSARQKSDLYAVENNVAKYKHLLHPRTSGLIRV